jgi:uncharacterized protein YndB with AHSA1/START domain
MAEGVPDIRSVVVERDIAFPPEKIWRALTQPHLIADWLLPADDFSLDIGNRFAFRQSWGNIDCQVRTVEPNRTLAYTWAAFGLESTVTWTLTPIGNGTRLRMEQRGFRPEHDEAVRGATYAWPAYFTALEKTLSRDA